MTHNNGSYACQADVVGSVQRYLEHAHRSLLHRDLPFVTVTYAQSLDGCIAGAAGETMQLSNPESQRLTHQLRAMHDAILVGINTVVRDNPRLNVRLVEGENPQPVVVDSQLRFPSEANLLRDPCVRPIIVGGDKACPSQERRLTDCGAKVFRVPERRDGRLELSQIFVCLKQRGFRSVMVEGGASIITSIFTSRLADQCLLTISPRIVGGLRAVHPQSATHGQRLPRLHNMQYQWLAQDLILRGDLERTLDGSADTQLASSTAPAASPAINVPRHNGDKGTR